MAFGDVQPDHSINDYIVTNNGDTVKLFATIFRIIIDYLKTFPHRKIYFSGSSDSRMRLYRMAVSANLKELEEIIRIFGVRENGKVIPFKKEINYIYFLVAKSKRNYEKKQIN